ncbi:DUF1850 domain-containing protein [Phyllobacterium sp. 21LDTY02-6]|jgi:hypothetical protein|uniref:DUF1850 domain-containing protein n=1 Tax=Phyllobacterium sp. 21LDTY02-6 TaxID=2944903 RepID=UPI002021B84A|nr:DUF1850 domain-containing protein [Phyllobacterium sp. 21LDTY02-6]MCO4316459.1 DUF1850 domain-containing protein [Phyllobacterium sp. 21LDTY02-6]
MSLCLLAAGKTITIAATAFTLSWTHSVEKTRWQESWTVGEEALQIVEARVKGSGAGMEPPPGSELKDGWWIFKPDVPPQKKLVLASSGTTSAGWEFCAAGDCREIAAVSDDPVSIKVCREG